MIIINNISILNIYIFLVYVHSLIIEFLINDNQIKKHCNIPFFLLYSVKLWFKIICLTQLFSISTSIKFNESRKKNLIYLVNNFFNALTSIILLILLKSQSKNYANFSFLKII